MTQHPPHIALRVWRASRGLTQVAAAAELGIPHTTYRGLEKYMRTPCLADAVNIRDVAGIPVEAWLEGMDEGA